MKAALGLVVVVAVLPGCESTADKSAAIAREGRIAIRASGTLKVKRSGTLRVARAVVVRGDGGAMAAAVEVRNGGAAAAKEVPVLIDVRGSGGRSLYKNDTVGLQPALQRLASVRPHATSWWVNDQVTTAAAPRSVKAVVGAAPEVRGTVPDVALKDVHFDGDATGRYLTGVVVNPSRLVLKNVPIFAVALKGSRVVAAGRALVPKLPAAGGRKQTHFRLFFVGDPRGARIATTVAPTVAS
ncbi:MAG TPA: hypothetical protein VNT03_03305 [Baekduia sp.]|nr:hypothetical protein [Baekduia sp.]